MTENKKQKTEQAPTPLMMNAVYRVTDAQKALGIGRRAMDKLKREGLPVRRVANKDYVAANDLWAAMEPMKPAPRPV